MEQMHVKGCSYFQPFNFLPQSVPFFFYIIQFFLNRKLWNVIDLEKINSHTCRLKHGHYLNDTLTHFV